MLKALSVRDLDESFRPVWQKSFNDAAGFIVIHAVVGAGAGSLNNDHTVQASERASPSPLLGYGLPASSLHPGGSVPLPPIDGNLHIP